jgi:serine/threonine-protein kinase
MLGYDGQVKVLDFGIALVKGRMTVTEHGTVKGKPPYMSPEQVRNEALDRRSDVWSAALILHELLTGKPVFDGESLYAVARAVIEAPIPPPSAIAGALPPGLDDAVMKALVRDRDARTPTAAALADELERIAAGGESLAGWTERAFAAEREAHREWLATLVAGPAGAQRVGRPSGVLTARAEPEPGPEPEPARRSRRGLAVLLLLLLALLAIGLVILRAVSDTAPAAAPDAAAVAVAAPDAAAAPDAPAPDAAAPRDAAVSETAPRRRTARAAPPVDAAPPAIDAAPAAAPAGSGKLTVTSDPFVLVEVDGRSWDSTPIYGRKIAAGRHTVVCRAPDSGDVVKTETVEIVAGELARLACN